MSSRRKSEAFGDYLYPANFPQHALALCLRTGGLVTDIFWNSLFSGLLHNFLRPRCLLKEAPLLLFGAGRSIRGDAVSHKCGVTG